MILRLATHAMATRFELVLSGEDERSLRAAGECALDEVRIWHDRLSFFQPDSLLSHINREAGRRPVRLDAEVFELFLVCDRVWRASDGAFDPAASAARRCSTTAPACLGPCPSEPGAEATGATSHEDECDDDETDSATLGWRHVHLDASRLTITFARPDIALDLGAVAKGFALDRAADILRSAGAPDAFLHGGTSSAIALGPTAHSVRIRSDAAPATITLHNAALGVSAPRGRVMEGAHHILDPRTGAPSRGADTAAVVTASAVEADAWSTALVVLGARPTALDRAMTSLIHTNAGWRIEGPLANAARQAAPAFSEVA